ncbi:hypothetical protein [Telmatospirillum sp.]|uniref:hypothetical protein n=1 Tax=Telmatospirillum sp. TaxID=2079197 RepID=UPI00283E49C2|nr:hypothetical protein [Telmatospirillum sp.]MDR3436706.1 hypothetical protein [Telmatospirillum sp.]
MTDPVVVETSDERNMMRRKWLWPVVALVFVGLAAAFWFSRTQAPMPVPVQPMTQPQAPTADPTPNPAPTTSAPAPAPAPAPKGTPNAETGGKPSTAKIKTSGSYADDWMKNCAPLGTKDQDACTKRLEAAYGKTDEAPVPASK